jgi:hypothetical protein
MKRPDAADVEAELEIVKQICALVAPLSWQARRRILHFAASRDDERWFREHLTKHEVKTGT